MDSKKSALSTNSDLILDNVKWFGVCNGETLRVTVLVKVKTETVMLNRFSLKD
jgi:hypothetical protein